MTEAELAPLIIEIRALLREKLSVRGKTFEAQLRKSRRLLPKQVRRDATYLAETQTVIQNPKLARMINPAQIHEAHQNVIAHLQTIDPRERRKDRILGILGYLALNFLLLGAAIVTWLVWTDRV